MKDCIDESIDEMRDKIFAVSPVLLYYIIHQEWGYILVHTGFGTSTSPSNLESWYVEF